MAERNAWPTQNTGPTGILSVEDTRLGTGFGYVPGAVAYTARSGFRPVGSAGSGLVYATTPTPDGNVKIDAFQLVLQTVRSGSSGPYVLTLDATKTINILSTPANATNPRDDLIIARVTDTFHGDGSSVFTVEQVVGTPAAVPTDPAVGGSQDYITLARVRVIANAVGTDVTNARITDLRESGHAKSLTAGKYTVGLGGLLPVDSLALRTAIPAGALYDGFAVWRRDLDAINVWDGSGWRYFARPTAATVAASETTGSTSFTDLATAGPAVTIETGTAAEVTLYTQCSVNTATQFVVMGFAVSGASTIAAADNRAIGKSDTGNVYKGGATFLVEGLTPGANVFTCKYRVTGGTGSWNDRRITAKAV